MVGHRRRIVFVIACALAASSALPVHAAEEATTPATATATTQRLQVVDGVVQPRRPVPEAIADAMRFLKLADDGYVPGKIDGELAGYFERAHVNEDGTRVERRLAFPARQHAYFIFTFLRYGKYSGEAEWLQRARDLADWNLAHSTPPDAPWPNLPYSAYVNGNPGGSADKDSTEPDKAAFIGSAYIALYEATKDQKYLDGAKAIAKTLVEHQGEDGSWPFRVVLGDGSVRQAFGGAPVFFVQFFEDLLRHADGDDAAGYRAAHDKALKLMLARNVERGEWGTYHEDIGPKPETHQSAEAMSFTAEYLFRHAKQHPEYVEQGKRVLKQIEDNLVHTEGHPAAPAPAVSEQTTFAHMMPGHTARYCLALIRLHQATGDEQAKKKALSGINALTYMQSDAGLFRTFFQLVNERKPNRKRPNWYSQHLYTVCHVLEAMEALPELGGEKK